MSFIERLKGFLLKPTKTFKAEQKTTLTNALKYGLIGLVILAILTAVVMWLFGSAVTLPLGEVTGTTAVAAFFGIIIAGFIGLIISGLWIHLWAYAFGARKGIGNTIKTMFYAYSPVYILGWIPIVNFLAKIWYLVLMVIGLTQLQKLSTGRAIGAVVIAIVIPLIIVIALVLWAISLVGPEFLASMEQLSSLS